MLESSGSQRRLSLALLARDDAEGLAETLVSARHVAQEMVVVDTGSTDDTRLIARQLGAKVVRHDWQDSFSAARNAGLPHISGDWILWLDAGEKLSREDGELLREFVQDHADLGTAYFLRIALPALIGSAAGEQVARLRLHPQRPGLQFQGNVRESLDKSLFAFGFSTAHLPIVIQRGPREHLPQTKLDRAKRNLSLANLQVAQRGLTADLANCLGEAWQTLANPSEAGNCYRQALELAPPQSKELLEAYYGLLSCLDPLVARVDTANDNRQLQLSLCLMAIEKFPLDIHLLCALGGYLQASNQMELAARTYQVAYQHGKIEPEVWHLPDIREIAACGGALVRQRQGKLDEAAQLLHAVSLTLPNSWRVSRQLIQLYVQLGRRDEALVTLQKLPADFPTKESWRTAILGACAAAKGNWRAAKSELQMAFQAGCRERFCLRWLCRTLLELAELDAAQEVLAAWRQADIANPELDEVEQAIAGRQKQLAATAPSQAAISPPPLASSRESPRESPLRFDPPQPGMNPKAPNIAGIRQPAEAAELLGLPPASISGIFPPRGG